MDWIDLAQDRDRWRALVNAVCGVHKIGEFLTSWVPVSFSIGTLLRGVSLVCLLSQINYVDCMHLCIKPGRILCLVFNLWHTGGSVSPTLVGDKLAKYILCLTVNVDGTIKLFKTKQFHWHSVSINNIRTIEYTLVQCGECSLRKLLSRWIRFVGICVGLMAIRERSRENWR